MDGQALFCDFVNAPKTTADKIRADRVRLQREHTATIRPRISGRSISVFIQLCLPLYLRATSECLADLFLAQSNKPNTLIITNASSEVHSFRYSTGPYDQIFNWFVRMLYDQILNWVIRTFVPLRKLGLKTGIRCMECQAFGKPNSRPEGEENYPWSCRYSNLGRQILFQLKY
jgi:hypothetical protein